MTAATALEAAERRLFASYGLSPSTLADPLDYRGRPLRAQGAAQMRSIVDALGLDRVAVVGTSLGGWWALCLAPADPSRVSAIAALGIPALAFAEFLAAQRRRETRP